MNNASTTPRFHFEMYKAALEYYGLSIGYTRTFKQIFLTDKNTGEPLLNENGKQKTALSSCNLPKESLQGNAVWVQVNEPFEGTAIRVSDYGQTYPKKAKNSDIHIIYTIPLDFEYPQDPRIAHEICYKLIDYLIEQGLAEQGLPGEDTGGGCHIGLPINPIETTPETAIQWNSAITEVVKSLIKPEFDKICQEYNITMDLSGFDISRVLSLPGTWRPYNPEKNDCKALQHGYLRRWLPPYTGANFPERHESANLTQVIRDMFESQPAQKEFVDPSQWLRDYAAHHPNSDRSGLFQTLVNATFLRYDEYTVLALKDTINYLSGEKFNGRIDKEIQRSLDLAKREAYRKDSNRNHSTGHTETTENKDVTAKQLCDFTDDDAGNGDAMEALFGEDFLYCPSRGWFYYTGTHWKLDPEGSDAKKCAVKTLRIRRHSAIELDKESVIKCTKGEDKRVNGCINRFKTLVSVSIDEFDNNPDVLNCKNGVVNLETGDIQPHSRDQRFTYCIPVAYRPEAYSQLLPDYLAGVVGGGQEVIDYLQLALGYSMTGHTREEILFYLFGPPRSGKGTISEIFMALMPSPLSTGVDFNSFTAKREGDVSNFDLAPLKTSRMIFASESQRGQSLNPAKIKQLTGGDRIRACFKHKDFFEYRPQFKVWMLSNWPVNGDPEDDALWGRVKVIEFPNSFLGQEDKTKKSRLQQPDALEAVLAWGIEGSKKWYALGSKGLTTPDAVKNVTLKQRAELDYVQQWLEECCETIEESKGCWEANEDVAKSYATWCKDNNVQYPKSPRGLSQSLQSKGLKTGVQKKVDGKNKKGVEGLYIYSKAQPKKNDDVFER